MASRRAALRSRVTLLAAVVALAGLGDAQAQAQNLRDGLFGQRPSDGRRRAPPPVARYVSEEGAAFTLDRSGGRPLLKFDSSSEVWALQAQPAPRGDVIYKNDLGDPVLRATRLGGLTLFTEARPGGTAVALAGNGQPIKLAPLGPQALLERLAQASARASRASKRLIPFEADAGPGSAPVVADAAFIMADAVARLSKSAEGRAMLSRLNRVTLVEGKKTGAVLEQGVMRITVVGPLGPAGRPSSERLIAVLDGPDRR